MSEHTHESALDRGEGTTPPSPKNVHGTTTRVQSRRAPARAQQILRACAVEMHFEDLEVNECIVNSSELARHADEHLRSDTRP